MILRVEREKFRAESGFTVLLCDELDEKGRIIEYGHTVVGTLLPEIVGTTFEAECIESNNDKYGRQLKVVSFIEKDPDTAEGIIALIVASKLRGIGEKTARKIVEKFGKDTIRVMDNDFSQIKQIKGIRNTEKAEKQWKDSRAIREMMQVIGKNTDIGPTRLLRIKSYFKQDTLDVLKNYPYRISEVKGVTFYHADALARNSVYFDPNDDARIQSGIRQTIINAMEKKGHMFLTGNELVKDAVILLNKNIKGRVTAQEIQKNTNMMCKQGILIATNIGNGMFAIYLASAFKDETEPVTKIIEMLDKPMEKAPDTKKILEKIRMVEKENGMLLADMQKQAIINGITKRVSIITGGPGKGKTTTLNSLLSVNESFSRDELLLMAPTGRAARRMRESTDLPANTIHSCLNLKGDEEVQELFEPVVIDNCLVVIDEMSMVDGRLFNRLMQAVTNNSRIVFVGDVDQLPSVGAGNVFAELINSGVIPTTVLDVPFRQAEQDLIYRNANLINDGITELVYGDNFRLIPAHGEDEISEICCRLYEQVVDEYAGDLDRVALLTPFRKSTKIGSNEMNLSIRDKVNHTMNMVSISVGSVSFRPGDKVMQLKNISDEDITLSNGDVGYIKELSAGTANDSRIEVSYNGVGDFTYETREDMEMLDLAYASTIHKAQGSEVDVVIMPMSKLFSVLLKRNLVYTGVSRAKVAVFIVGDEDALKDAIRDNTYARRNTLLAARLRKEYKRLHPDDKPKEFEQLSFGDLHA